ncbi:MAG: ComEA family DNA-binding protein [Gammaproteobacteria bacterium]
MFKNVIFFVLFLFSSLVLADPIDINSASADDLAQAIKGVGPAKAAAIVAHREKHGPFASIDDLALVQGIGEKTVQMNRETLTIGNATQ